MSETRSVRWYVVASRDDDGADKSEVSAPTRERAIEAGRVMYHGRQFGVWRGEAVTERDAAEWMVDVIECHLDEGQFDVDMESGSDESLLVVNPADRVVIVQALIKIIRERRMLTRYYHRWVDYEDVPAAEAGAP